MQTSPVIMPKALIQQRLLLTIPGRGGWPKLSTRLRLDDVAEWTGVKRAVLDRVARKRQEVDDSLQVQLSSFLTLFEAGLIVKVVEGGACVLRRVPTAPGVKLPPRATIDLSGLTPRVHWS